MDDLISRQAAIDKFKSIITDKEHTNITDEAKEKIAREFFADIPSSTQRWTPCNERPPERKSDWKNVTVLDESGDTSFTYSSVGFYLSDGCWVVDNEPMEDDSSIRVIAWMPLPEPYKEGEA